MSDLKNNEYLISFAQTLRFVKLKYECIKILNLLKLSIIFSTEKIKNFRRS